MARIVYGVSGEGSGHSSRAAAMGRYLVEAGHTARMVSYDRGYRNLHDAFDVFETQGLHIANRDNRVSISRTITENLRKSPQLCRNLLQLRRNLFRDFRPHAVITDFEPMTAYLARLCRVPLMSLDNQHRIRYMKYECPPALRRDERLTRFVIRLMIPRPDVSLVTTFYFGEPKNDHTFLFPPILRDEVRAIPASRGQHILVYLSFGFDTFIERLKARPEHRFVLYGYNRAAQEDNITFKEFSREGFLHDMAGSRAVMASAGFTTLTEALYYRKPYLALPMRGQFEQQLNAVLVEQLGYGVNAPDGSPARISEFLGRLDEFDERLKAYRSEDNSAIERKLDELLQNDCALLRRYRLATRPAPAD